MSEHYRQHETLCDHVKDFLGRVLDLGIDWDIKSSERGAESLLARPANYWIEAEMLYEDGATSPSVSDTFHA